MDTTKQTAEAERAAGTANADLNHKPGPREHKQRSPRGASYRNDERADNTPILFPPSPEPIGAEAAERKAARLREIKGREAAKTFERILNGNGPRRWEVTVP